MHRSKQPIEKFGCWKTGSPLFKQLEQLLREQHIAHSYVPKERLDRFNAKNHQGAIAAISPIAFVPLEELIDQVMEATTTLCFFCSIHHRYP